MASTSRRPAAASEPATDGADTVVAGAGADTIAGGAVQDTATSWVGPSPSLGPDPVKPLDAITGAGERTALPLQSPGPGAGAQRLAVETRDVRTVSLDALEVARYLSDAERAGRITPLERVRLSRTITSADAFEEARSLIEAISPGFDPRDVPGHRTMPALKRIRRDGKLYGPGAIEDITLDFEGYTELMNIGAVPPIDWATGEPVRI